jgi:hypothetical protein
MKKNVFILFFVLVMSVITEAQTKFSRLFWSEPEIPLCKKLIQTSDGGYVITGSIKDTTTGAHTDILLVKFNSSGDTLWTQRIGGSGDEIGNSVKETNDGGLIVAGQTNSYGSGNDDLFLVRTNGTGNILWAKTYGNADADIAYTVNQNSDSGFIIAGSERNSLDKIVVIRTNETGDTLWTKLYTDIGSSARYALQTSDGGFIVTGSLGNVDGFILKLSPSGSTLWAKKIVHGPAFFVTSSFVQQALDGNYVIISNVTQSGTRIYLDKFDINGNLIFGKGYDALDNNYIFSVGLKERADSTFNLITSQFFSANPYTPHLIQLKLKANGDTLWSMVNHHQIGSSSIFTNDGGVALSTYGSQGGWFNGFYKMDSLLNTECTSFDSIAEEIHVSNETVANITLVESSSGVIVGNANPSYFNNSPRRFYNPCTPNVPTCIVTVDSTTQKNLVIWEEQFDTTFIDSYQVYKETAAAGQYSLIGSVPHNQLSVFLDNASNPAVQSERYKVSALWNSYYEPPNTSTGHKTIHLNIGLGIPPSINLIWSSYEGISYSTYNIWRGNSTGVSMIASVPFGTNSYTDLNPPSGDSLYFIEVASTPCNPTARPLSNDDNGIESSFAIQYAGTLSNIVNRGALLGMSELENGMTMSLYPNPASEEFLLTVGYAETNGKYVASIQNYLGEELKQVSIKSGNALINVRGLPAGIYFISLKENGKNIAVKKFVKM